MNTMYNFNVLYFDPDPTPTPTPAVIGKQDVEPVISIDHINVIQEGFNKLMEILGVTNMREIANGGVINLYKTVVGDVPAQVGEGEDIPLTKVTRKKVKEIPITLNKYRKAVTAEAISADGYENAVNDTDRALVNRVRKAVKKTFFDNIEDGTGTSDGGANLQAAMAAALAALYIKYEDDDVTPLFVVHFNDAYTYLGTASISTQSAFGFSYLENFLGLGDVILTSSITPGTVWVTAKENLHGAVPGNGSDVADAMGMTADESGIVLMKHTQNSTNASLETLLMTGATFYAEDLSGVFSAAISNG